MITAQSMRPIKENGPGQQENLMAKMVQRTARKCTKTTLKTLGATMISAVLQPTPNQDSYVNLEVEEVIDPYSHYTKLRIIISKSYYGPVLLLKVSYTEEES